MPPEQSLKPQRSCIACRKAAAKTDLLRFVLAPDAQIVVDYRQHLPGRGAYTCFSPECIAQAVKKKSFQRIFSKNVVPVETRQLELQLQRALRLRVAGLVKMARKSGQIFAGSNQVLDAFKKKTPPALILIAADITSTMGQKIESTAQRQKIYSIRMFDKKSLGQMLGKEERSVIAVAVGTLAASLLRELHRYELVREN